MKGEEMKTKYWIEPDDRQWQLKKEADVKNKEGVVSRRESIVGYFPKFGQAASALYERVVAEKIGTVDASSIQSSITESMAIMQRLLKIQPMERVEA